LLGKLKAAFKTKQIILPDDIGALVDQALMSELLQRLGLEAKASQLFTGAEKIETAARLGQVALLLHAGDAAENGRRSLDQAWRVGLAEEGSALQGLVLPFDRDVLSQALGRNNCVHIAISDANAAERIGGFLLRLLAFRGADVDTQLARIFPTEVEPDVGVDEDYKEELAPVPL